jgi:hypothetical protein
VIDLMNELRLMNRDPFETVRVARPVSGMSRMSNAAPTGLTVMSGALLGIA